MPPSPLVTSDMASLTMMRELATTNPARGSATPISNSAFLLRMGERILAKEDCCCFEKLKQYQLSYMT